MLLWFAVSLSGALAQEERADIDLSAPMVEEIDHFADPWVGTWAEITHPSHPTWVIARDGGRAEVGPEGGSASARPLSATTDGRVQAKLADRYIDYQRGESEGE